ncbi:MAG: DUF3025 domain-containing protein [Xanthomonadales bacterium]|nr:DUF3025 domain-containing protein [Xanthomonadales bacterium]
MRFVAPAPQAVDARCRTRPPLDEWFAEWPALFPAPAWPSLAALGQARDRAVALDGVARPCFVAQDRELLADGLHYEQRVAAGRVATRVGNWHDLLNALVWLRWPRIKRALNAAQVDGIAEVGPRVRTRRQCALTHFDEAGAIVLVGDDAALDAWDRHDWFELFATRASAWGEVIAARVFGHATLEHALVEGQLLVAKAVALRVPVNLVRTFAAVDARADAHVDRRIAELVGAGELLVDPQDLRPLPLSGIPGWDARAAGAEFLSSAPCFRPLRAQRRYPPPANG